MKSRSIKLLFPLLLITLLGACSTNVIGNEDGFGTTYPSQMLSGDVYVLERFEKIDGNIVGIDTTLIIEEGAAVLGDISLLGSDLEISGRVSGDINLFGGQSTIKRTGIVTGSINKIANEQDIEPGAVVYGEINTFSFENQTQSENFNIPESTVDFLRPGTWVIIQIIRNILLLLLNVLIIFLFSDKTIQVSAKLRKDPLVSFLAGLLLFIAVPFVSLVLILSICLSPIGLILIILLALSNLWGWTILSYTTGKQLAQWFKFDVGNIGYAIIGSLFFTIIFSIMAFIPVLSLIASRGLSTFGVGAIILHLLANRKRVK